MTFQILPSQPDPKEHPSFITVYHPIAGWKAVQYWWNPDMDGFWEPWQTAPYAFRSEEQAVEDALIWAECEELPFYYPGYKQKAPEHMSESPDYDPSQSPRSTN